MNVVVAQIGVSKAITPKVANVHDLEAVSCGSHPYNLPFYNPT
jgi:hypothetical protein